MSEFFLINMPSSEMAERFATPDPTDKILSMLDGDEPLDDGDDPNPLTMADMARYLDRLPKMEADVIELRILGKSQTDIATIMGITQAGISYRLTKALERIKYLRAMPEVDEAQMRLDLAPILTPPILEIMVDMSKTSCQSETALNLGMTQGRVRHNFVHAIAHLEAIDLQPYARLFRSIQDNLNILREVNVWHTRRKPATIEY